ncbi:uncharacterized protein LOC107481568 [Arachis duranensis]|uniref:Uncharacterized protein LOC107481568 n=1 Tax=Arachis duranensis TaxID=130453 RepID=A0A6P4D0L6_ARADU|nr:uncharacterized protein LOC107481568 [Arachis duranensis]
MEDSTCKDTPMLKLVKVYYSGDPITTVGVVPLLKVDNRPFILGLYAESLKVKKADNGEDLSPSSPKIFESKPKSPLAGTTATRLELPALTNFLFGAVHSQCRMELEPWAELDVDDSDLSSFLRPCKRFHSHSNSDSDSNSIQHQSQSQTLIDADSASPPPPLIPGPAGAVQAAMMHRRSRAPLEEPLLPTQEFIRRVVQNGHESDHDFTTNAWLSAFHFLRSLDRESDSVTPLNSIKKHLNVVRVPLVVAVIKSCTPNGFGDMMVTLKDPTGTISASVHHKTFSHSEYGKDITVGSVVVLQKVAVFAPTRSTCYLNITLRNILKIFCNDNGVLSGQIHPSISARQTTPDMERHEEPRTLGNTFSLSEKERTEDHRIESRLVAREGHEKSRMPAETFSLPPERTEGILIGNRLDSRFLTEERHEESRMMDNTFALPQERTEGIMTNLSLGSKFIEGVDIHKQMGEDLVVPSCHSDDGNNRNQKSVFERENLSFKQDNVRPEEVTCGDGLQTELNGQHNPPKSAEGDNLNLACSARDGGSLTKNSIHISAGVETEVKNHLEGQRVISNPQNTIPHWTDEQLDELLAFD